MNNFKKYIFFAKYILYSLLSPKIIKNNNIIGFRENLSKKQGIDLVEIKSIIDWDNVKLKLINLPHDEGHVSIIELLILSAFASKLNNLTDNNTDIEFATGKLSILIDKKNSIHMKGSVSDIKEITIKL